MGPLLLGAQAEAQDDGAAVSGDRDSFKNVPAKIRTVRVLNTQSAAVDDRGYCQIGTAYRGWRVILERDTCPTCHQPLDTKKAVVSSEDSE